MSRGALPLSLAWSHPAEHSDERTSAMGRRRTLHWCQPWVESGHSGYHLAMTKFGSVPRENDKSGQQPEGYATATVHLGEHTETVAFWLKLWSPADYMQHWQESAAAMLGGQSPALFCTDYAPISCSCFVGWPADDGFLFEEWVIKHEDLPRECLASPTRAPVADPGKDASHFPVATADVEMLVGPRSSCPLWVESGH
jgi:hypothetical protein